MKESPPDFRDLYEHLTGYEGTALYADVLAPWWRPAALALHALAPHRRHNTSENPYPVDEEELWQWFALNVVNDFLLLSFQMIPDFYQAAPGPAKWDRDRRIDEALIRSGYAQAVEERHRWQPHTLELSEYVSFFEQLGFGVYTTGSFTPFHYEIVEVIEDTAWVEEPVVEHVYWPGLKFGEMLFSRAGVRVRCRRGRFIKEIAENSILYFTNRRYRRLTEDPSHGWGSSSRWGTRFRRDYETDTHFHYNVDGNNLLGSKPRPSLALSKQDDLETLTLAEQVELLTHRSFVQCAKDDTNRWPYQDRLSVPKVSGIE